MNPMDLSSPPPPPNRILLLIDLQSPNTNPNPNSYISSLRPILLSPYLSSSLFSFRLLFSSLSPLLSSSLLHSPPTFLSFNSPIPTLHSILHFFNNNLNVTSTPVPVAVGGPTHSAPSPTLLSKFLLQILHDYPWEEEHPTSKNKSGTLVHFRPNLVLLFSPTYYPFSEEFYRVFAPVNEKFVSRDIQFSWVGVDVNGESHNLLDDDFERGVRELGWGFSRAEEIALGSALVPFGLIFPHVGCSMKLGPVRGKGEVFLGIRDVGGKPLECKSCEVHVVEVEWGRQEVVGLCDGGGVVKMRVTDVWRKEEEAKVVERSVGLFLLRGVGGEGGESQRDFVADRVLRLLCRGKGEFAQGKPIWQLLLAFLYRRNCYASVSVLCADGRSFDGVLKPFTINYGFLSVLEKRSVDLCQLVGVSIMKDGKGKRNKMQKSLMNGVSWSSFCEEVYRQADDDGAQEMELEEIYFADETNKSKKLRFLKCWMRQVVKKSSDCCQSKQTEVEEPQNVDEEVKERVEDSSLPLTQESHCSGGPINQESCSVPYLEDLEAFLASIPQKVENGLSTKEVELSSLAARLVAQSIDAIFAKSGSNSSNESQVFSQVSHLLLVKPKDLALKYKSSDSETNDSTERIIRVNELQILLRMEILRSKIAESFEGNVKLKMVKEICSLLQNIEFYLQGNFFCGESLLEFAGRTIKSRYSQTLGDIIRKIYDKMEFFSFDDNDVEASDHALVSNSEEAIGDWNGNNDSPKTNALEPTAAHLNENNEKNQLNVHEKRLIQAQKTRDRARRFSSFTSWVPDLHRVWALKHPKVEKPELDSVLKIQSKRMKKKKTKYEMVCETPVPRKKQTRLQEDESSGSDSVCPDTNPCRLRSKALFQH